MIFKSLRTISTRALTFGSCVLQQSYVGMSIELLAIQLLLFKTRCNANSSSNNLGRFALKISNCHSTIGIKVQLCTFCLQRGIAFQHSSVPTLYFCTKVPVSYSPYNKNARISLVLTPTRIRVDSGTSH